MKVRNSGNIPDIAIESLTLQQRVFDVLKEHILSGSLQPGSPLNTNELAKRLNVSRTPVRDAVNRLVALGLAVKSNHKEARVADYMSDEMFELFSARAALEGMAAGVAARYMDTEKKQALMVMAEEFGILIEQNDDEGFMKLDQGFHYMIYSCLKTPLLKEMIEQMYVLTKQNREAGYQLEGRRWQVAREHRELAEAIHNGNHQKAEVIGTEHHANTIYKLRKQFESLKEEHVRRKL